MMPEPNPYAPPTKAPCSDELPEGEPLHELTLKHASRGARKLTIYPDAIHLDHSGDQAARMFDRASFAAQAEIHFFGRKAMLMLRTPKPAVTLWLSPEALTALRAWMEPVLHQHLSKALAGQRVPAIIIGLLWGLGALPASGQPADVRGMAFAAAWLTWTAAATWRPHRALFLVLAALWLSIASSILLRLAQGASWWNLAFIALVWPTVASSVRSFRFYGSIERAKG